MTESTREGLAIGFRWEPGSLARGEGLFVKGRQTLLHTLTTLSGAERFYHEMTRLAVEGVDLLNLLDDGHVSASNPVGSGRKTLNDTARDERHAAVRSMADRLADCRTETMFSSHDTAYDFWRFWLETGGHATDGVSFAPADDDQVLSASPAEAAASRAYDLHIHTLARVFAELHACDTRGELILPVVTRAGLAYLWILSYLPLGRARRVVAHMAALQVLTGQGGDCLQTGLATVFMGCRDEFMHHMRAGPAGRDVTETLLWFCAKVIEAQKRHLAKVEFQIAVFARLSAVRTRLNSRQLLTLGRMFEAERQGASQGFSAADHIRVCKTTVPTATRDLAGLVKVGLLDPRGSNKWRRYCLNVPRDFVKTVSVDDIR